MTVPEQEYQHTALPEGKYIRVCQLEAGNQADDVHVRLETFDLPTKAPYTALSYVWGSSEYRGTITCHGKRLEIPANLLEALKAIRHPTCSQRLWADSICIDQQSTKEKNHQVALIGKIYEQASKVTVWLDADPDDIAFGAFSLVRQIARQEHPLLRRIRATIPPGQEIERDRRSWGMVGYADPHSLRDLGSAERQRWEHLAEVYRRPWFTRIWVIQEADLASSRASVMCGNRTIPWKQLANAARWILVRAWDFAEHFSMTSGIGLCTDIHWVCSSSGLNGVFLSVLDYCRRFDCVDLRDKVAALLSHPSARTDNGDTIVQPDYSCSMSEFNVNLTTQFLAKCHCLELLSAVQDFRSTDVENIHFASWIPSCQQSKVYSMIRHTARKGKYYQSAAGTLARFHTSDNSTVLNVTGLPIDSIHRRGTVMHEDWFSNRHPGKKHYVEALISFISASQNSSSRIYPTAAARVEKCYMTLTPGASRVTLEDFAAFTRAHIRNTAELGEISSSSEAGDMERFASHAGPMTHNRRLFTTIKGYIGLSPRPIQEGDIICVLSGCPVPFVLRPSGERYRLVGECNVHGIMKDETIQAWRRGEYTEQEFVLY